MQDGRAHKNRASTAIALSTRWLGEAPKAWIEGGQTVYF
jgi:hypothetical protein